MKKIIICLLAFVASFVASFVQAQTFKVNNLTATGTVTAASLVGPLTGNASTATNATNATNLIGGGAGQLLCQTASGVTGYIAAGTNGYFLQAQVSGCPTWVAGSAYTPGSVAITGGSINGTTVGLTTPAAGKFTTIAATGAITLGSTSPVIYLNDASGSGFAQLIYENGGVVEWDVQNTSSTNQWAVQRYVAGVFQDYPITIANATGIVGFVDGISVTGTVVGSGFSTYLASPPCIGCTAPSTGAFTQATINPASPSMTEMQIGSGSTTLAGLYLGNDISGYGAIWPTIATPTTSNYAFAAGAVTYVNNPTSVVINVANSPIVSATSDTATIKGTTLGGNACAGCVGEYVAASNTVSTPSHTSDFNVVTYSLGAGDWEVMGDAIATSGSYSSGQITNIQCGLTQTSATLPAIYSGFYGNTTGLTFLWAGATPTIRITQLSSANVYLVCNGAVTSSSSFQQVSGRIQVRRER